LLKPPANSKDHLLKPVSVVVTVSVVLTVSVCALKVVKAKAKTKESIIFFIINFYSNNKLYLYEQTEP